MKLRILRTINYIIFTCIIQQAVNAQDSTVVDSTWTLPQCIDYALKQNIQVRKSNLTNNTNMEYTLQAKAQRFPSLNASARQNFGWENITNSITEITKFTGSNNTSYSLNTGITVFNGLKTENRIKQAGLDYQSGLYNTEALKESVSLNILNAYLQVLYAEELVNNSKKQVDATKDQLALADERLQLSIISKSDYLQVKSELASEKLTLANANSQLDIAKVDLEQLMELPVTKNFTIARPNLENIINQRRNPYAQDVYDTALAIKPQIKSAALNTESALLQEKIARAGYIPSLSADAGISTGYSSLTSVSGYNSQLNKNINPSVGLSLSIPIFQNRQTKTNVQVAKIGVQNAALDELNTKNQLRKNIEQACVDIRSAETEFDASAEQYKSTEESYQLSTEKFKQGMINSVDYLFEKTNLIVAESKLLQSKYNLVFSYKILDFYLGKPLTF
jgi:outer membrane protein